MKLIFQTIFFIFLFVQNSFADEARNWLKKEIDIILNAHKNTNASTEKRFLIIEDTINYNFAGAGIAKFVAGNAWSQATMDTKKNYINIFKKHLALSIASMMQGYTNQEYKLENVKYDEKNKVTLVDMDIFSDTGSIQVTWRVKKSKDRFFVIDLLVADISLVVTKRSEFNSMLKTVDYNLSEFNKKLLSQNESSYLKIIN